MIKLLLTRKEAAEVLGISTASVESLTKSGQLSTVRIGRNTRVHVDALNEFAKAGTKDRTMDGKELDPIWKPRSK